jgi:hypothetical protein
MELCDATDLSVKGGNKLVVFSDAGHGAVMKKRESTACG